MPNITINLDELADNVVLIINGIEISLRRQEQVEDHLEDEEHEAQLIAMPSNVRRIMPWELRRGQRQPD